MNDSTFFDELIRTLAEKRSVSIEEIHDELDAVQIAEMLSEE